MKIGFLSIIFLIVLNSITSKAFITVYMTNKQQNINANAEVTTAAKNFLTLTDKIITSDITVNANTFKLTKVVIYVELGQGKQLAQVTNAQDANGLTVNYKIANSNITIKFVVSVTLNSNPFDFTGAFINNDSNLIIKYGKGSDPYSQSFVNPDITFSAITSDCQKTKSSVQDADCAQFFTTFYGNNNSVLKTAFNTSLQNALLANLPFNKDESDPTLIGRTDKSKQVQFSTKSTNNPVLTKINNIEALIFFYNGNVKLATDQIYVNIPSTTPEFTNFFPENGDYQLAIPQVVVDKIYSLLYPQAKVFQYNDIPQRTISFLNSIFPEIARNYAQEDEFIVKYTTNSFTYAEGQKPVLGGVLQVFLPDNTKIDIKLDYVCEGIVFSSDKTLNNLIISTININSYISNISISSNSGYVDEYNLRNALNNISYIFEQEEQKLPLADGVSLKVLVKSLAKQPMFVNGVYIFNENSVENPPKTQSILEENQVTFLG